jgi:hypothetical protein
VKVTTRRATRFISAIPRARSLQWWSLSTAMAASNAPSSNGSSSATARTIGAAPSARCAIIVSDGSTATTSRSAGSYAPVPAPTLTTVRASPSAARMRRGIRGSSRRTAV